MNSSLDSGLAYNGKAPYAHSLKKVRAIARVWVLPYAYVVKANSGIKSVADLKGKSVAVKLKTNVSLEQANRVLLSTAGLTSKDYKEVDSGGVVAGLNMVVEGRVDAATAALSMPAIAQGRCNRAGRPARSCRSATRPPTNYMEKGMAGLYTMTAKPSKRWPFVHGQTKIAAFDTYINAGTSVDDDDRLCHGQGAV